MMMGKLVSIVFALSLSLSLLTLAGCGNNSNNGSPDLSSASADMAMGPDCVTNPMTSVELLNACTTAQSGDPAKDAPYFPSLAPSGTLPPLP